jgi:hypothetical protein
MNKVFAAEYNSCYHESSYGILSLHSTYEGAADAMFKHKEEALAGWKEMGYDDIPDYELWRVHEYEVLE